MGAYEVNFDGIVGPTHNYAGLSYGNVASMSHKASVSNPRQAALQGLEKMRFVASLGLKQAVLPPHERPHLPTLKRLGFDASSADPMILAACSSASAMWAANAATVSPSADTADHRVHFTPANLVSQFHRSIEPPTTKRILDAIFLDKTRFQVHEPLPCAAHFADEGAANHTRLCRSYDERGVEIFVFGRKAFDAADSGPRKFPARQTLEACQAIARRHLLDPAGTVFVCQNPAAIDAGAFHNDVVSVGNEFVLLEHNSAHADANSNARIASALGFDPVVHSADIPLADAVGSYLFNSQLVTLPDGKTTLIAPTECRSVESVQRFISTLGFAVHYVDVRQSMNNGGGPACLRLRVVLTDDELAATNSGVLWSDALHQSLTAWVKKHYRESLEAKDLADPLLLRESCDALDALSQLLRLGTIYDFQM